MPPKKSAAASGDDQDQCPTLKLIVAKGPFSGQTNVFQPGSRVQIGRVVRGNTISFKDSGISSKHLLIQFEPASESGRRHHWSITDLGSSNGTILNEAQIEPSQPSVLSDGDLIKIGEATSIKVKFEISGAEGKSGGGDVRRNARRGVRTRGGELGVIKEEWELGLGDKNANDLESVGRDGKLGADNEKKEVRGRRTRGSKAQGLGLGDKNANDLESGGRDGKLGADNEEKEVRGRRTRGSKAQGFENEGEEAERKLESLRKGKSLKKQQEELTESTVPNEDEENSDNADEVKGRRGRKKRGRPPKVCKKDEAPNKIDGDDLGRQEMEEGRVVSMRRTRSSRKEENFIDLRVSESIRTNKGTRSKKDLPTQASVEEEEEELNFEHKKNLPTKTLFEKEKKEESKLAQKTDPGVAAPLEEESNLGHELLDKRKKKSFSGDDQFVEDRVNSGSRNAAGVASTSGFAKEGVAEAGKGKLVADLKYMTLGEWFDFLEVFLPQQIIDATEDIISDMRQKAERLHEFELQHKNAKEKGKKI